MMRCSLNGMINKKKDDEIIVLTNSYLDKDLKITEFLEMVREVKYPDKNDSDEENNPEAVNDSFNADEPDESISENGADETCSSNATCPKNSPKTRPCTEDDSGEDSDSIFS